MSRDHRSVFNPDYDAPDPPVVHPISTVAGRVAPIVVAIVNSALPESDADFDAAEIAITVRAGMERTLGPDLLGEWDAEYGDTWITDQLNAIRRSRSGLRGHRTLQANKRRQFEELVAEGLRRRAGGQP